ncbi:hypothetical protein K5549_020430, partial [Capra hircus]
GPRLSPASVHFPCSKCPSPGVNRAAGSPDTALSPAGIAEILMNRPSARNALGNVFVSQLLEALAQLREDRQVRVLIFRSGVKGVFCAGADLKEQEQMSEAEVGLFIGKGSGVGRRRAFRAFPAPTIAAMDGFALGGGLELALACDLRVAASSAVMGLIETTRGLLPGAGGTQRLPRCLGVALAKSGAQVQALGLVNHAVAQNEEGNAAYHRARALAQEILPQVRLPLSTGGPATGDHRWGGQGARVSHATTQGPFSQIYKMNRLWQFCFHSAI